MKKFISLLFIGALCMSMQSVWGSDDEVNTGKRRREHGSPASSVSSSSSVDLELSSHILKERGSNFHKRIRSMCSDPKVVCIDFSSVGLKDEDLDAVFKGLVERTKNLETIKERRPLLLLNVESDEITQEGLLRFLTKLQNGKKEEGATVYPDMRGTVLKIGFSLTDEFMEAVEKAAPNILAGRLRIVD